MRRRLRLCLFVLFFAFVPAALLVRPENAPPVSAAPALNLDFNESGAPSFDFNFGFNDKWWGATDQPNVVAKYRSSVQLAQPYLVRMLLDGEFYAYYNTSSYPGMTLIDRYLQPIIAAGATPLIDFTVTPPGALGTLPAFAAAVITRAKQLGYNPTGWGIDLLNETNDTTIPGAREHWDPADWCNLLRQTRAAVSAVQPGLFYGGPGASGFPRDYLATIVGNCADVLDFISIHLDFGDSLGGVDPNQRTFYDTIYDLSNNVAGGGTAVNLPPNVRVLVDEYNINKDQSAALSEIWRPINGAFVADMLAGALVINVAAKDNPARGRLWGMLFYDGTDDGSGLSGSDPLYEQGWWLKYPQNAIPPISASYSPAYYAHRLASMAAPKNSKLLNAGSYHFPGAYQYLGDPFDQIKPLAVIATHACNGYNVLVINRSAGADSFQLNIANFPAGITQGRRYRVYSYDGYTMPLTDTGMQAIGISTAPNQVFNIAPYEVTLINFAGATGGSAPARAPEVAAPKQYFPAISRQPTPTPSPTPTPNPSPGC